MRYYRNIEDNIVTSVNTVDADGSGNITEEEYAEILALLRAKPNGKLLSFDGEEYSYVDRPPDPDYEVDDEELLDILMGGAE